MCTPTVRDVMSSPVIAVAPHTRLPKIKRLMHEHRIRHVPVVQEGTLAGIISLGDIRNAFPSDSTLLSIYELSYLLDKVAAADILRTSVITIQAEAPLLEAVRLMLDDRIGALPVFEADRMVGIITESDIFRALLAGEVALPQ